MHDTPIIRIRALTRVLPGRDSTWSYVEGLLTSFEFASGVQNFDIPLSDGAPDMPPGPEVLGLRAC